MRPDGSQEGAGTRRFAGTYPPGRMEVADDGELALEAARGSRAAFEELVRRYAGAVNAALERRHPDPHLAQDLCQEVWVRAFRGLAGFRPGASFRSWLFGIAFNALRDERRRAHRATARTALQPAGELDLRASGGDAAERDERRAALDALMGVEEPFRTALALVDLEGFSYEEAARALACAVGTVKSRVSRGRSAFRERWERGAGAARDVAARTGGPA